MKFGYARVSTKEQNLDLQIDALEKEGVDRIYKEVVSGAKADRPELARMLDNVREGDTIVIWKLDRLGRSLQHLIRMVEDFKKQGINLVSLNEKIDTTSAGGELIFHIFASIAQFERNLIRDRTNAGLAAARARGRKGGRPKVDKKKVDLALKMYESKMYSIAEILDATGMSKGSLYNYIDKRNKEKQQSS
ncbi:recombinase family protein [Priestia megaterium]|uniref:recombinase family protein n=1 Tax=Priestia megaterium TaxID=1404 RepID=UPI003D031A14